MKDEIAILMAAGKGTRLFPLTLTTPKPLIKVHGVPMIETVIQGLQARGVAHIYVVVGYLKEQFAYLEEKYPHLTLVENPEWNEKNNIASLYAASKFLGECNCFICDSDLDVQDPEVFCGRFQHSTAFGRLIPGETDEWVYHLKGKRIVQISAEGGKDAYTMGGITYFLKEDARKLKDAVCELYRTAGNEQLFWDEVLDRQLNAIELFIHPISAAQVVEVDSVRELAAIDRSYRKLYEERTVLASGDAI